MMVSRMRLIRLGIQRMKGENKWKIKRKIMINAYVVEES